MQDQLEDHIDVFREKIDKTHRYASFDFCYGYFQNNRGVLSKNMLLSCLQLWSYLASWGMLRGSSELLQRNASVLKPLMEHFDKMKDSSLWSMDVQDYSEKNINIILDEYAEIDGILEGIFKASSDSKVQSLPTVTLVSKIMLGVYSVMPAYDHYFMTAMRAIFKSKNGCSFNRVNKESLSCVKSFYDEHKQQLETIKINVIDFDGNTTNLQYKVAKLIDMYGFTKGIIENS